MRYFLMYLFDSKEHFLSSSKCSNVLRKFIKCRIKPQMAYVLPWDLEVLSILAKPCVLNKHIAWQCTMYRAHYFLNIEIDVCIQSDEF